MSNLSKCVSGDGSIVHSFIDSNYNRSSLYIKGGRETLVADTVKICKSAYDTLFDSAKVTGTHPNIGLIDNVQFVLPPSSTKEEVSELQQQALLFGEKINNVCNDVPVYMYGREGLYNPPFHNSLKTIRRQLNYFGTVDGGREFIPPTYGRMTSEGIRSQGVMCVGCVPFILNFNVRIRGGSKAVIAKVTQKIRGPVVEALTLPYGDGGIFEIACNLLNYAVVSDTDVLRIIQRECVPLGLEVIGSYTTSPPWEELAVK